MSALKKRKGNVEDAVNDILNAPVKKASPGKTSPTTHTSKSTMNDFFKPTKNKNKKQKKELPPTTTTTTATTTTATTPTHQNALSLLKNPTARDIKPNSRRKGLDLPPPEFQFLVVLDYEWTCDSKASMRPHAEIIEWGCVLVDLRSRPAKIVSEFQEYVKPKYNPRLTDFCKELTAITQEQVDKGSSLEVRKEGRRLLTFAPKPNRNSNLLFSLRPQSIILKVGCVRTALKSPAFLCLTRS